jgi:hypothetical protein
MAVLALGGWLACAPEVSGQGCIAVRGGGQCSLGGSFLTGNGAGYPKPGEWLASLNYRWLHSERLFSEDSEFTAPAQRGAQPVNDAQFIDLSVLYTVTPRFSLGLTLPFTYATRSTTYEHDNRTRRETSAGGIGDIRLMAYYWLLDPEENPKGNISLGLGPKFPTGDYDVKDTFYTTTGPQVRAVDPSIQPGDGGFGFAADILAFRELAPRGQAYLQGSYLFNPQDTNGVPVTGGPPSIVSVTSIADQYSARFGVSYTLSEDLGLSVSLGPRIDGVPATDAFGDSNGFRRPGYAISIEPGITWMKNGWTVAVTAPVALYRNRIQSNEDKRISATTGVSHTGDAAFADFFITASISRRF